mmetsp:Transcript_44479/g.123067  ORF Transcript_44479/g.123067 Transcript_44479/m.123067 type:complete len:265 (-) Transcript_44479:1742-2536(-)
MARASARQPYKHGKVPVGGHASRGWRAESAGELAVQQLDPRHESGPVDRAPPLRCLPHRGWNHSLAPHSRDRGFPRRHVVPELVDELYLVGRRWNPDRPYCQRSARLHTGRDLFLLLRLRLQPGPSGPRGRRDPRAVGVLEEGQKPRGRQRARAYPRLGRQDFVLVERADRGRPKLRFPEVLPKAPAAADRHPRRSVRARHEPGRTHVLLLALQKQRAPRQLEVHIVPTGRPHRPGGTAESECALRRGHPRHGNLRRQRRQQWH